MNDCKHLKPPCIVGDTFKYCGLKDGYYECGYEFRWEKCKDYEESDVNG